MADFSLVVNCPSRYKIDKKSLNQALLKTLASQKVPGPVEIEVVVVGRRKMGRLHQKYLHTHEASDVLSFPLEFDQSIPDGITRLGSIVVCYPVAVQTASCFSRSVDAEIAGLVRHGCLHLLGIHHR